MRNLVAFLYILSVLFPLLGVVTGWRRATSEARRATASVAHVRKLFAQHEAEMEKALAGLKRLSPEHIKVEEQVTARHDAELRKAGFEGHTTWDDIGLMKNIVWAFILKHAVDSLKPATAFVVLGIVLGGIASVWSLYLPSE